MRTADVAVAVDALWDEILADLRGEKGSHESLKPCLGVGGVWMPEGERGDGVVAAAKGDMAVEVEVVEATLAPSFIKQWV